MTQNQASKLQVLMRWLFMLEMIYMKVTITVDGTPTWIWDGAGGLFTLGMIHGTTAVVGIVLPIIAAGTIHGITVVGIAPGHIADGIVHGIMDMEVMAAMAAGIHHGIMVIMVTGVMVTDSMTATTVVWQVTVQEEVQGFIELVLQTEQQHLLQDYLVELPEQDLVFVMQFQVELLVQAPELQFQVEHQQILQEQEL